MENCELRASYTTELTACCRESLYNSTETSVLPGDWSPGDRHSASILLLINVHGSQLIQEINLKSCAVVSQWHLWREMSCQPITISLACCGAQKTREQNCLFHLVTPPPMHILYMSSELFLFILLTKCYCQHCSVIAECVVILGTGLASYSAWVGSWKPHRANLTSGGR